VFVFIDYFSDMFRLQFLAIFRELVFFAACMSNDLVEALLYDLIETLLYDLRENLLYDLIETACMI